MNSTGGFLTRMTGAALTALILLAAGCSASDGMELAEQAVPRFHKMLDAGQFDEIYAESASDLKKATTREDFVALLDAVHRKLGPKKTSTRQGWKVDYNTSGSFVTLSYATTYTQGEAVEQFVYRLHDNKASLVGYHINSNALIIN